MRFLIVSALVLLAPGVAADINVLDTLIVHTEEPGVTVLPGSDIMVGTQDDPCYNQGENCDSVYVGTGAECQWTWGDICFYVRSGFDQVSVVIVCDGSTCLGAAATVLGTGPFLIQDDEEGTRLLAGIFIAGQDQHVILHAREDGTFWIQVKHPVGSMNFHLGDDGTSTACLYDPDASCYSFQHTTDPLCVRYSDVNDPQSWNTVVCET